jgi:hypothetical protein
MQQQLLQQAQESWARLAPHLEQVRALVARAATGVQPAVQPLTTAALRVAHAGARGVAPVLQHLRTADGSTLATYSAAAGMLVLFANHLRQPKQVLPRRRLFLPSIAIKHAMGNGADVLADPQTFGISAGSHVLVACQAMEAVEVMSYCNLLRAETYFIDGKEQSSAVAFALRVRPVLFVYDSDVVAPQNVRAIASALKNAGCKCVMIAVQEMIEPSHAQYNTVFHKAMTSSARTSHQDASKPEAGAGNGTSPYSFFDAPSRSPGTKAGESLRALEGVERSLAYGTTSSATIKSKKDAASKRDSDIFQELGSAVVGLFGQKKAEDKTKVLEKALRGDSQFDREFDQRYKPGPSGGAGLLAL